MAFLVHTCLKAALFHDKLNICTPFTSGIQILSGSGHIFWMIRRSEVEMNNNVQLFLLTQAARQKLQVVAGLPLQKHI